MAYKYVKVDAPLEVALCEIEELLRKAGIVIHGYSLTITYKEQNFKLVDVEMGEGAYHLPRTIESERLRLVE